MSEANPQIVHANVFDPATSIFKQSKSARAQCQTIVCSLPQCDLRDSGHCICRKMLNGRCPYGRYRVEEGPTRRAGSCYSWLTEHREQHKGVPYLNIPPNKLAFVGEYVYLPYAHMDMCKGASFVQHSSLFVSGVQMVPRSEWNVALVLTLTDFQPRAIFTGEVIRNYQETEVPLFHQHLRELDPEMWKQVIAARPALDTTPNYVGRKAYLATLRAPISIPAKDPRYPVPWEWDGTHLTTRSKDVYSSTWGGFPMSEIEVRMIPAADATVLVAANDWITAETKFAD